MDVYEWKFNTTMYDLHTFGDNQNSIEKQMVAVISVFFICVSFHFEFFQE